MENQVKDELKELKEAFENWRNTRPGKKGVTPEELRNKVIKLLESHSIREINKVTKVHSKQLKKWQNSLTTSNEKSGRQETEISFLQTTSQELIQSQSPNLPLVVAPLQKLLATTPTPNIKLEKQPPQLCSVIIERTDGNKLIAQLPLSTDNLDVLFSFIKVQI